MCIRRISRRWRLFMLGFVAVICFKLYPPRLLWPTVAELTELEKCPACFGVSMCPAFTGGLMNLNGFSKFSGFINLIGSKNVLFALFGDERVVLKKLGHNWELEKLDKTLCGGHEDCRVGEAVGRMTDVRSAIIHYLTPAINQDSTNLNSLRLCPSVINLDRLLSNVFHKNKDVDPKLLYANIWTLLVHNAEPLILQILCQEEGWPVPKYYGACGRVVMEEYVGSMLSSYLQASWLTRAQLAQQLLVAASHFTDKHPHFRFYLTDISMDNIAVDMTGTVKFIDLENIIIVDKNVPENEQPVAWSTPHVSENFECDGCFAFSSDEICNHHTSDHNYFAVCQLLGGEGGLLYGAPWEELRLHPQLPGLLRECTHPSVPTGRFAAAHQLIALLANITRN